MQCKECYSENNRITPLNGARECLENHKQYICSNCGRNICINIIGERKARCFFPFSSKDQALLYLKSAEIIMGTNCGIYELVFKSGKRYKIFESENELNTFLDKNKNIKCENKKPVYKSKNVIKISSDQMKHLTKKEVEKYLLERKQLGIKDK